MGGAASIPFDQVDAAMLEARVREEGSLFAEYADTIRDNRVDGATVHKYFAQGDEGAAALLDYLKVTDRLHRDKLMGMLKNAVTTMGGAAESAATASVATGRQELAVVDLSPRQQTAALTTQDAAAISPGKRSAYLLDN